VARKAVAGNQNLTRGQIAFYLGVVAVFAFLCWRVSAWWDGLGAEDARRRNQDAAQQQQAQAEATRQDDERRAKAERDRQQRIAVDAAERALSPEDRAKRMIAALPDVCEAKRLLATAPDVAAPGLSSATVAMKAAEAKQLLAERPDFDRSRGIVCADGSGSDCMCSGSHRGCCSHHRGIAGCVPYPTEVACPSVEQPP